MRSRFEAHFDYLARAALLFGAVAVLALVPLDYAVVPGHFPLFALYRVATALALVLLFPVFTRTTAYAARLAIVFGAASMVAAMVALMIRDFGGHRSVYFAGFLLVFVFVSCYLPLPPRHGAAVSLLVYAIYLLPILAYDTIVDRPFFIAANSLMLACVGAMLLLQNLSHRRVLKEFALQYELDRHRGLLGECVAERTRELARKVEELEQAAATINSLNAGLEDRVRERTSQLENANRQLEAFSYSISHDLRSPLRAIHGFATILHEDHRDALDDDGKRCLIRIRAGAIRMSSLVDDLLAFARLGMEEARRQTVAPATIVAGVLDEVRAAQQGAATEVAVGDLPDCWADPAMLRQVFMNLLANAFKFTRGRAQARIEVGCRREGGPDVYFVSDNGAGFDMRYADKLFGVFQRLHGPDEYEGTGVGLAIVKRIVEKHGGTIWATAAPGAGAKFSFTLSPPGGRHGREPGRRDGGPGSSFPRAGPRLRPRLV